MNKTVHSIQTETMQALMRYSWPGNIRQLQNVIERAMVLCDQGTFSIDESRLKRELPQLPPAPGPFASTLADREREMIEAALAESQGRISGPCGAAARLGIPRQTLDSKIANLRISKSKFKTQSLMRASV